MKTRWTTVHQCGATAALEHGDARRRAVTRSFRPDHLIGLGSQARRCSCRPTSSTLPARFRRSGLRAPISAGCTVMCFCVRSFSTSAATRLADARPCPARRTAAAAGRARGRRSRTCSPVRRSTAAAAGRRISVACCRSAAPTDPGNPSGAGALGVAAVADPVEPRLPHRTAAAPLSRVAGSRPTPRKLKRSVAKPAIPRGAADAA